MAIDNIGYKQNKTVYKIMILEFYTQYKIEVIFCLLFIIQIQNAMVVLIIILFK